MAPQERSLLDTMTLREIAEEARLSMADVAFLARLPKSTLSRLWDEADWLDRVTGHSLKHLISAVPGLIEQLGRQSCGVRLDAAVSRCAEEGLVVRPERVRSLIEAGCPVQRVISVLEAAVDVMRLNEHGMASYLARCWGPGQDGALDALLAPPDSALALLVDSGPLVERAMDLLPLLRLGQSGSLHTTVAYGSLVHKLTKSTGVDQSGPASHRKRKGVFAYRSATIGLLLGSGDAEAAEEYRKSLEQNALLAANELWSFATYSKDVAQTLDFSLPKNSKLTKTATDVIGDVLQLNEAYLWYLASTAIPVLLGHDQTFGGQRERLAQTLVARLERGLPAPVSSACASLAVSLSGRAVLRKARA